MPLSDDSCHSVQHTTACVHLRDIIHHNWLTYSEQYLQTPLQLEHAFQILLNSELFEFHSERMCEIIMDDTQAVSPLPNVYFRVLPCCLTPTTSMDIFYVEHRSTLAIRVLQCFVLVWEAKAGFLQVVQALATALPITHGSYHGRHRLWDWRHIYRYRRDLHRVAFYSRSHRGQASDSRCPIAVWGMQDAEFFTSGSPCVISHPILSDKSWFPTTGVFDDDFIDHLFDLVEQTRDVQDDTFNYSVIKLIVCFLICPLPCWLMRALEDLAERTIYGCFSPFRLSAPW